MAIRRDTREFLAGVLAAMAMTAAMAALRLSTGLLSLPEILGEGVVRVMPAELFSRILDTLLRAAKPTLLATLLIGQLALGGLLGRLYGRGPGWGRALGIVLGTWLMVGLVLLPLLRLGLFGAGLRTDTVALAASLLAVFLIYALALVSFHRLLVAPADTRSTDRAEPATRRAVIARIGLGLAAVVIGGFGWRALNGNTATALPAGEAGGASPPTGPGGAAAAGMGFQPAPGQPADGAFALNSLSTEVTPTRDFYTVSKNFFDPNVDVRGWSLKIDGLVERPHVYDYEGIQKLPSVSNFYTLQCISNPVGGDLWGNAYWKGVRLRDLLQQAGLQPGIRKVVFHAADDYTDSIVLDRALNEGAILAYEMNGTVLEKSHGFPARLLIPNIYGMKNVKWITRIELVDYDFKGYWMQRGWDDAAPYKVSSRFDVPSKGSSQAAGEVAIGGVTFAGERGIQEVEYSLDDGQSWQPAQLKPALATNTWQLWVARPTLAAGRHVLQVRARDGKGTLQSAVETDSLPDGASGYHTFHVVVA